MQLNKYIIILLIVLNFIAFITYGIDKYKAKHNHYRFSESTLLLIALPFSALGALLGMYLFHHKTKKIKFMILIPLFLIVQLYLLWQFKNIF